ncbi:MAG: outer membrane lipoprotein-sorting protein [Pyrinomonadaceae bacterium]|nr:outer membrane lipoprotein-sorting protein [Pyrinomonadaceae bacterium]
MILSNNSPSDSYTWNRLHSLLSLGLNCLRTAAVLVVLVGCGADQLLAQKKAAVPTRKLPSAEKVVDNYLKAIGGKKRIVAIREAAYDWTIQLKDQTMGTARTQIKAPGSVRTEMTFGNGQIISAANTRSAWVYGFDGQLRTLTGAESDAAKLKSLLDASRLVDYKKLNVMARVVSLSDLPSETSFIVEFSTRNGARLRYWFSANSKLLLKIEDEASKATARFADYRVAVPTSTVLEPHQLSVSTDGSGELTLVLQRVDYNKAIPDTVFNPPVPGESLDVAALLREVGRNQDLVEKRVSEYAFMQKEIDREISSKGEIKKETTKVYEVFPLADREPITKLVSENGVPLSGERAAKEAKRVTEEFLKAERDREKNGEKAIRRRAERLRKRATPAKADEDDDPVISQFLKVCEFVSPRRERFHERDAVVFDFRPRPGYRPRNRQENLISKVVGVVWIDPIDKQVMRLEARLAEGFKMAGGLFLSLRPGAGFVIEQTRMAEGVWLPRLAQVNLSVRVLLFGGGDLNKTIEWSDYKHFKGDVGDYKLDAPKTVEPEKKP